jgi:hypothetical protein
VAFGGHAYVLPLVEVVGCGDTSLLAVNLVWTDDEDEEEEEDDDDGGVEEAEEDGGAPRKEDGAVRGLPFADARARAAELLRRLPAAQSAAAQPPPTRRQPPPVLLAGLPDDGGASRSAEEAAWAAAVDGALADIARGAYEKVVLARKRRVVLAAAADSLELCAALREDHGYLFLLELDERRNPASRGVAAGASAERGGGGGRAAGRLVGASPVAFLGCTPELLFACDEARGEVATVAIAGTRPRGEDPEADAQLGEDLMASAKVTGCGGLLCCFLAVSWCCLGLLRLLLLLHAQYRV